MNSKIVLGLAVLAGLVAVFLVQKEIDNIKGETITVYKSTVDQPAGELLGSQIEEVTIPAGLFPNLFKEAPTSDLVDMVSSTPLREDVQVGDILLYRHFDSSVDQGILGEITEGMKAISIPVTEVSSVAFFVQPGDMVDVLATFLGGEEVAGPQQNQNMFKFSTRPVVQAVKVLAVGDKHRRSDRQMRDPYSSVTLLVTMEEAAKLIFARDFFNANMTLALRGQDDTNVESEIPSVGVETLDFDEIGNQPEAAKR